MTKPNLQTMPRAKRSPAKITPRRGRPRPEDIEIIKSKLLDVALQEFLTHGYGDASMARIAKSAGGSKTTLYSRYPSKEALFRAIILDQIDHASPQASLTSSSGPLTLEEGLKSFADHMLEHSLQPEMMGVNKLIYSEAYRFPELAAAAVEKTQLGINRITKFIQECATRDQVTCNNPEVIAKTFIFMIRGWYVNVLLAQQKISPKERKNWVTQSVNALLNARQDW